MVHTWLSVRNDRIVGSFSMGARHLRRALATGGSFFYGDYDLDVYIGTRNDYDSLWDVAATVLRNGSGWLRTLRMEEAVSKFGDARYINMNWLISELGSLSEEAVRRLLPRRESGQIQRTFVFRRDGNFKLIAVETERLYYVFCFATS